MFADARLTNHTSLKPCDIGGGNKTQFKLLKRNLHEELQVKSAAQESTDALRTFY